MSRRRVLVLVGVAVIAVVAALLGRAVWQDQQRSALQDALDVVPRATQRLAFTDWAAVREALDVPAQNSPTSAAMERLVTEAYDSDLGAVSSMDEATAALQEHFGFSAATAQWEAFAQSSEGATMVVKMPDGFDMGRIEARLDELGFEEPDDEAGVWKGGVDLVAGIDPTISPELQYVAVLAERRLVVTSDTEAYAAEAARVALGDADSLADLDSAREVVEPLDQPAAAMLWARDFACEDLAMSQADEDSQQRADQLVDDAGGVTPLSGLAMAMDADRRLTVSALFEDDEQARDNLRSRARLAVGEAPGRGGSFSDELELVASRAEGEAVVLELRPQERTGFVLSSLYDGPVLFATC